MIIIFHSSNTSRGQESQEDQLPLDSRRHVTVPGLVVVVVGPCLRLPRKAYSQSTFPRNGSHQSTRKRDAVMHASPLVVLATCKRRFHHHFLYLRVRNGHHAITLPRMPVHCYVQESATCCQAPQAFSPGFDPCSKDLGCIAISPPCREKESAYADEEAHLGRTGASPATR